MSFSFCADERLRPFIGNNVFSYKTGRVIRVTFAQIMLCGLVKLTDGRRGVVLSQGEAFRLLQKGVTEDRMYRLIPYLGFAEFFREHPDARYRVTDPYDREYVKKKKKG